MPQIAPFRCRAYGSTPLAHLRPRTYYNASWKAEATSYTPSPQSPAPSKHPQKRGPQQTQARRHSTTTTTPFQTPAISSRPDMIPRGQPGVPHLGFQDGPKHQSELKNQAFSGVCWVGVLTSVCKCSVTYLFLLLLLLLFVCLF
jgi:hypothetical protein